MRPTVSEVASLLQFGRRVGSLLAYPFLPAVRPRTLRTLPLHVGVQVAPSLKVYKYIFLGGALFLDAAEAATAAVAALPLAGC